jgi:hypothetical protein
MNESIKLIISDPKSGIDESVRDQNHLINKMSPNSKPMIIKELSKKY